ncbi:anti-sigma factor [Martelella radicis]|uniref:Regulator of SigK n=1 Tax=Martelella radicis TaxID=1397476 RepID=A0A7W6KMB5_9HYPH|nr:anti-sigma factor [Martelella radicis]MBB4123951.1 anti-sigma-K factor RskA [Martelella radicis]
MKRPTQQQGGEPEDEMLAGEYVIGALSDAERRAAEARIARDPAFAALVRDWQNKLEPLDQAYGTETPSAEVFSAIEQRLFAQEQDSRPSLAARLWGSAGLWRGVAAAAVIAAVAFTVYNERLTTPQTTLLAELSGPDNAVNLVARYNARTGRVSLTPVAAGAPDEKSLELWLIEGEDPPVSLGVLPQTGEGELTVPSDISDRIGAGTFFAVSIEPYGGSQTGGPTGPVIAVGELQSL